MGRPKIKIHTTEKKYALRLVRRPKIIESIPISFAQVSRECEYHRAKNVDVVANKTNVVRSISSK